MSNLMHRPPTAIHNPSSLPTISVFGNEVPLPIYFQIIERHNAGHNVDSIIVHMVATTPISNIDTLRDTVEGIILNLRLIENSSHALTLLPDREDNRRNSRIEFVGDLDDLNSAGLMAEEREKEEDKEKERVSLRQRLFGRLG